MAKKSASKTAGSKYTKPDLREKVKEQVKEGSKGGKPGQWSARKAQLLSSEYKKKGGGFTGEKDDKAKSLDKWSSEQWTTSDGKPARRGKKTTRYLPKKAWDDMSAAEKKATKQKKEAGSKEGKQYVGNTKAAKASRKKATKKTTKKKTAGRKKASSKKASKKVTKKAGKKATKKSSKKAASKKKVGRPLGSGRKKASGRGPGRPAKKKKR